jgi:hypothetical protein
MTNKTDNGFKWVSRVRYNNLTKETIEEVSSEEQIAVPNFEGATGRVGVSAHVTKNLGNFESARVGVELSLPTLPIQEELVRVYDELQTLAASMIDEQLRAFDPVKVEK